MLYSDSSFSAWFFPRTTPVLFHKARKAPFLSLIPSSSGKSYTKQNTSS